MQYFSLILHDDPQMREQFAYALGVSKAWQFADVYGLDEDLLAFLPQPTVALLLLFPITSKVMSTIIHVQPLVLLSMSADMLTSIYLMLFYLISSMKIISLKKWLELALRDRLVTIALLLVYHLP